MFSWGFRFCFFFGFIHQCWDFRNRFVLRLWLLSWSLWFWVFSWSLRLFFSRSLRLFLTWLLGARRSFFAFRNQQGRLVNRSAFCWLYFSAKRSEGIPGRSQGGRTWLDWSSVPLSGKTLPFVPCVALHAFDEFSPVGVFLRACQSRELTDGSSPLCGSLVWPVELLPPLTVISIKEREHTLTCQDLLHGGIRWSTRLVLIFGTQLIIHLTY